MSFCLFLDCLSIAFLCESFKEVHLTAIKKTVENRKGHNR